MPLVDEWDADVEYILPDVSQQHTLDRYHDPVYSGTKHYLPHTDTRDKRSRF